jgi:hypothetical protein
MERDLVRDGLRFKLAKQYRENPTDFLSLSREVIDSALSREIVSELRNEGHVEEEVRGTIRLTPRGYRGFRTIHHHILIKTAHHQDNNLVPMIIFAVC